MRACPTMARTVHVVGSGHPFQRTVTDGRLLSFGVPDQQESEAIAQVLLSRLEAQYGDDVFELEADFDGAPDELADELQAATDLFASEMPLQLHPTWWAIDEDCAHGGDLCSCGFVSLIEVLHCVEACDRAAALAAHLTAMREVWHHYWSAQALIESGAERLEGTCAWCIIAGRDHLEQLADEAADLAEQFGEAIAGFDAAIDLGEARYHGMLRDGDAADHAD